MRPLFVQRPHSRNRARRGRQARPEEQGAPLSTTEGRRRHQLQWPCVLFRHRELDVCPSSSPLLTVSTSTAAGTGRAAVDYGTAHDPARSILNDPARSILKVLNFSVVHGSTWNRQTNHASSSRLFITPLNHASLPDNAWQVYRQVTSGICVAFVCKCLCEAIK